MSNVVVRMDPAGNIKPNQERSGEKIDGVVAIAMPIGRILARAPEPYFDFRIIISLGREQGGGRMMISAPCRCSKSSGVVATAMAITEYRRARCTVDRRSRADNTARNAPQK
jgi:hypothetical protein